MALERAQNSLTLGANPLRDGKENAYSEARVPPVRVMAAGSAAANDSSN